MFLRKMIIADQIFDDTYDASIDSLIANVEALACTENRSMIFIDHKNSMIKIFHYNEELFAILGCSENDLVNKLDVEYDISSSEVDKYIELINSYIINQGGDHTKVTYFAILCMRITTEKTDEALCLKIMPYIYAKNKSLHATLIVLSLDNHYGAPKLIKHNIDDESAEIYLSGTKTFIDEGRTKLLEIEIKILNHSAMGEKEADIADQLDVSLSVLKRMKAGIFEKMKVKSISEAIFMAYKQGLMN